MELKKYYLGWGWGSDENVEPEMGVFFTYDDALSAAKKAHKEEIEYQKSETKNVSVPNTYVFYYREDDCRFYTMAKISGKRSSLMEYEYEWSMNRGK